MQIANLDVVECQTIFNGIDKPSVKDDCFSLLNEMLNKAVKCRYIDFNPLGAIEIKKHKKKHGIAFTREQEARFVEACKTNYRGLAFLIGLYCGLRRGEILALTTDDIHIEERYIVVSTSIKLCNNKHTPKCHLRERGAKTGAFLFRNFGVWGCIIYKHSSWH